MTEKDSSWLLVAQQSDEGLRNQVKNFMEQADEASLERFQAFLFFCLDRIDMDESSKEIWSEWNNK